MTERVFGRLKSFDERSRLYPIRQLVRGLPPKTKLWECSKVLDQGNEGSCVGHGIAHELIATPVPVPSIDHTYARMIYLEAKKVDEWPGEDYEGTSVIAGLKVAKKLGWYDNFRWAFNLDDIILGVGYEGPAVMGTNWYTGMMDIDSDGFVHATGVNEGGHCWGLLGIDIQMKAGILITSWGQSWGRVGRAFISFDGIQKLMDNSGECAFVIGRHDITVPIPPEPEDDEGCMGKVSRLMNLIRVR